MSVPVRSDHPFSVGTPILLLMASVCLFLLVSLQLGRSFVVAKNQFWKIQEITSASALLPDHHLLGASSSSQRGMAATSTAGGKNSTTTPRHVLLRAHDPTVMTTTITTRKKYIRTPIIVLSLPKSGTTSLHKFFACGGLRSYHTYGTYKRGTNFRIGQCIKYNYDHQRPLLQGCRPHYIQVYSDIGTIHEGKTDDPAQRESCFYPSIQALEPLVQEYGRNATFVLSYRDHWFEAVQRWRNASLVNRWKDDCPIFPNTTNAKEWQTFYQEHRQRIRDEFSNYGVLGRYFEFHLSDPTAGSQLESFFGIPAACWQNCKPDEPCQPL